MTMPPLHPLALLAARAMALAGVACLVYPLAAVVLTGLNTAFWHHDGYIDGHLFTSLPYLVVGGALLAWPIYLVRQGRPPWRPRQVSTVHRVVAVLCGILGVALMVFAGMALFSSLLFDLTFIEDGQIGASFSMLGVWLAYLIAMPPAAVLLAVGVDAFGARGNPA